MSKFAIAILVLATTTLAGCGNPYPRRDPAYLDRSSGTYTVDRSPYEGDYRDRCYCGPRY